MSLSLVTPPAVEPVTLVEAKAHLRETSSDSDTYITTLITAARSYIDGKDGILNRAICTQTWELLLDEFPDEIAVPLPTLQSVESVKYLDSSGVLQTLSTDDYTVDEVSEPGRIVPVDSWPTTGDYINAVTVRFIAGYGVAADVPTTIKQAMLLLIGHWYENREAVVVGQIPATLPIALDALLGPHKVWGV